jgi:hypothetical protein
MYDMVITANFCVNRIVVGLERGVGKYIGLETSHLDGDVTELVHRLK